MVLPLHPSWWESKICICSPFCKCRRGEGSKVTLIAKLLTPSMPIHLFRSPLEMKPIFEWARNCPLSSAVRNNDSEASKHQCKTTLPAALDFHNYYTIFFFFGFHVKFFHDMVWIVRASAKFCSPMMHLVVNPRQNRGNRLWTCSSKVCVYHTSCRLIETSWATQKWQWNRLQTTQYPLSRRCVSLSFG